MISILLWIVIFGCILVQYNVALKSANLKPSIQLGEGCETTIQRARVFSAIQPTGNLHIGNYFGAINQWLSLQHSYDCMFSIVDLHSVTADIDPERMKRNTLSTAALYLACGVDPKLSTIFVQSHVPQHAELCWLLSTFTSVSKLNRMTQYKEKHKDDKTAANVGLFLYPILMAADILLYNTDVVPVGEDQRQHLELTRDIARKFNAMFCKNEIPVMTIPQELVLSNGGAKIMSLANGRVKMSKSDKNNMSRINLLDSKDEIRGKIRKSKTDSILGFETLDYSRSEAINFLNILKAATQQTETAILRDVSNMNWESLKDYVADVLIEIVGPIQKKYIDIVSDSTFLDKILSEGKAIACEKAEKTMSRVRELMGFYNCKIP